MKRRFVSEESYEAGKKAFQNSKEYEEMLIEIEHYNLEQELLLEEIEQIIQSFPDHYRKRLLAHRDNLKKVKRIARELDIVFDKAIIREYDKYVELRVEIHPTNKSLGFRISGDPFETKFRERLFDQKRAETVRLVNDFLQTKEPNYRLKKGAVIEFILQK